MTINTAPLLPTPDSSVKVQSLAKQFKNARKDRISAILESLQALGRASETKDGWVAG